MRPAPDPNLAAMLLDICRPDGPNGRLAMLLGTIEMARSRFLACKLAGMAPVDLAGICIDEFGKIVEAKTAYDEAVGLELGAL